VEKLYLIKSIFGLGFELQLEPYKGMDAQGELFTIVIIVEGVIKLEV